MSPKSFPSNPLRISTGHVHAAGAAAILALVGLAYAFGFAPSAQARHQADLQQQAIERTQAEAAATAEHVRRSRMALEGLENSIASDARQLLDSMQAVRSSAEASGLMVRNLVEGEASTTDTLVRQTVSMQASGTFSDISSWLRIIREESSSAVIDTFSISRQPGDPAMLTLQATLSLYTPQPVSPASAEGGTDANAAASTTTVR